MVKNLEMSQFTFKIASSSRVFFPKSIYWILVQLLEFWLDTDVGGIKRKKEKEKEKKSRKRKEGKGGERREDLFSLIALSTLPSF
jgi:hypothetical protein